MALTNKIETQLLVPPHIRTRAQALAVVRDETLAEVYRRALEGAGLPGLERAHAAQLHTLTVVLFGMGIPPEKGVGEMLAAKPRIRYADLFMGGDIYGTPLERFPYRMDAQPT